jgi:ABC-type multidrug transport system permease subunit
MRFPLRLISLWFGLRAPVSQRAYAMSGFGLMALKYAVEAAAIRQVTGRWLSPLVYLSPLLSARGAVLDGHDGWCGPSRCGRCRFSGSASR